MRWSLVFLLILSILIPKTTSSPSFLYNYCPNPNSIAPNSTYNTNLNTLLHSLSTNSTAPGHTGFFATSTGPTTHDAVYGLFLCRGDQNATACQDCVTTATTTDFPDYCPNAREAILWYEECMVRYSNESLLGKMEDFDPISFINNEEINGNTTQFQALMNTMMNKLADQAAKGDGSGKKYATNETRFTSVTTLYGLVECTPDLTESDCRQCLTSSIRQLRLRQGAQVLQFSCRVRYDNFPFYNGAIDLSAAAATSAPQPSPVTINSTANGNGTSNSNSTRNNKGSAKIIIALVVLAVALSIAMLSIGICCYYIKKKAKYDDVPLGNGEDFTNVESLRYDLAKLKSATSNFSDKKKLGEGGFGAVYMGTLSNGQEIAVKRLSETSSQGVEEFKSEVLLLAKLQHKNLVRLLGFCLAEEEKLLVYEYVPNKSLDYFLFDSKKQGQLDWGTRYKIIGGIARGMLYLHHDSRLRIIHRDLKASNILLDKDMNPKIADFGTARIVGVDQSQINTNRVVGTMGYLSPEYAMHGQFSVKSDVYSFGVIVLEIICGQKNNRFHESSPDEDLLSYAWRQWKDGTPLEFVDPPLRNSCSSDEVMRCLHLALLCVQESVDERPTMAKAVLMLDDNSSTLPVPERPVFLMKNEAEVNSMKGVGPAMWSNNDVSITVMEPR